MLGAQGIFGGPGTPPGSRPASNPANTQGLWTSFTVTENASYAARLVKVPGGAVGAPLTGIAKAYFRPGLRFGNLRLRPGTYRFQIVLTALTNPVGATPGPRRGTARATGTGSTVAAGAELALDKANRCSLV